MEEEKSFKVIDRRGRQEEPEVEPKQTDPLVNQELEQELKLDFASFVMSLAHQAVVLLGEVPNPETNLVATNLEAARQTIDILGILEEKTVGNLDEEEKRLLTEILSSLRMAFVKKSKGTGV